MRFLVAAAAILVIGVQGVFAELDAEDTPALPPNQTVPNARHFDFGPDEPREGFVRVPADAAYSDERGYGFEASDNPRKFSVRLPEGNYRVTIVTGDRERPTNTTVK